MYSKKRSKMHILLMILFMSGLFLAVSTTSAHTQEINVRKPNGGERWGLGKSCTINWRTRGLENAEVRIELFQNGAKICTIIPSRTTGRDSAMTWKAGKCAGSWASPGSGYKVCIMTTNGEYSDCSDQDFSLLRRRAKLPAVKKSGQQKIKAGVSRAHLKQEKPDLVITRVGYGSLAGDISLQFRIKNRNKTAKVRLGSSDRLCVHLLSIKEGARTVCVNQKSIERLNQNGFIFVNFPWGFASREGIRLTVDLEDKVEESNETNNRTDWSPY